MARTTADGRQRPIAGSPIKSAAREPAAYSDLVNDRSTTQAACTDSCTRPGGIGRDE